MTSFKLDGEIIALGTRVHCLAFGPGTVSMVMPSDIVQVKFPSGRAVSYSHEGRASILTMRTLYRRMPKVEPLPSATEPWLGQYLADSETMRLRYQTIYEMK